MVAKLSFQSLLEFSNVAGLSKIKSTHKIKQKFAILLWLLEFGNLFTFKSPKIRTSVLSKLIAGKKFCKEEMKNSKLDKRNK